MISLFFPEGPGALRLTLCSKNFISAREVRVVDGIEESSISKSTVRCTERAGVFVVYQSMICCVWGKALQGNREGRYVIKKEC